MFFRMTGILFGLIALLVTPASAGTAKKASEISESLRHSGGHVEFTDMSARRRHRAVRHHARRHHVARYRVSRNAKPNSYAAVARHAGGMADVGGTGIVAEARRYLGTNPTGRSNLWCATFMNMVLERSGHRSSGSNMARSFASYGTRLSGPQVGAIAVMSRGKRGGHVGVVSGIDANGNVTVISGNHGRRVAESTYSRGRIYAYVMP